MRTTKNWDIFRVEKRLRRLFSFKDKLPTDLQSYFIYRYTCRACNSSYIGKTDRHQNVRWCEHLKITPITRQPSTSKSKPTAVQEHITSSGHQGSLEDFEVMGRENTRNDFFLRVKESLLIKRHKPKLNENEASTPLFLFWGIGTLQGRGDSYGFSCTFSLIIKNLFIYFSV